MVMKRLGAKLRQTDIARRPTKIDSLKLLRDIGIPVKSVIDVGAQNGTGELLEAFPDVPHLVIEPIEEFRESIERHYGRSSTPYELIVAAISDQNGTTKMTTSTVRKGEAITHARMVDETIEGRSPSDLREEEGLREIPMFTLTELMAQKQLPAPALVKIDVDGAEMQILRGAEDMFDRVSAIVIEAGIKTFLQRAEFIMSRGFQCFDIVDLCYYDSRLVQTDMIFVKDSLIKRYGLEVYERGFDINKWEALR